MGSSNFILKTALDDDQILIPGTPPSPNSRVLKKLNADLMHLLLQVDIEERHFIMMVYITQIQTLLKDQAEYKKRMHELDEIKDKIKYMQLAPKTEESVRLNHAQIEFLKNLKDKIEHAIGVLNQKIFQLENEIGKIKEEINNLDREVESSFRKYQNLIDDAVSIEKFKETFKDVTLTLPDGKELIINAEDAFEVGKNVAAKLKINPDADIKEETSIEFDETIKVKLKKERPDLTETEQEKIFGQIKSSDKNSAGMDGAVKMVAQHFQTEEILEAKNAFKGKIVERAEKQVEKEKLENELTIAKENKKTLEDLQPIVNQALETGKCKPSVINQLEMKAENMWEKLCDSSMDLLSKPEPKAEAKREENVESSISFKSR